MRHIGDDGHVRFDAVSHHLCATQTDLFLNRIDYVEGEGQFDVVLVQQAGNFVGLHLFFCASDETQCLWVNGAGPQTLWSRCQKSLAFLCCCGGVLLYSIAKGRQQPQGQGGRAGKALGSRARAALRGKRGAARIPSAEGEGEMPSPHRAELASPSPRGEPTEDSPAQAGGVEI